jgi:hypothetical protein
LEVSVKVPVGFHVDTIGGVGDGVGLTAAELREERAAKGAELDGRKRRRLPAPVQNPFDEILRSLGLWDRVQAVCKTRGVAVFELGGTSKARRIHAARCEVYRMLRALDWSNVDIGKLFDKDPSTVRAALSPSVDIPGSGR